MKLPKKATHWGGVTIKTFQECFTITNLFKGKDDVISVTDRDIRIINSLSDIPIKEIESWKGTDFDEARKEIAFIYGKPEETKLPIEFDCNGKHYKSRVFFEDWQNFSPLHRKNLAEVLKMKGGQIIDYTTLRGTEETDDDYIYNLHKILACVCVPAGDDNKYTYTGYTKVADELLQHLTMDIAFPLMLFFSNVGTNFYQAMITYSRNQLLNNLKKLKKQVSQLESQKAMAS